MKCAPDTALAITRFVFFVITIVLLIMVGTKYYYTTKDTNKGVLVTVDREMVTGSSYWTTTETTKTTTSTDGNTFSYPISNTSGKYSVMKDSIHFCSMHLCMYISVQEWVKYLYVLLLF